MSLFGSALARAGPSWIHLALAQGKLLAASHRSHPSSLSVSKTSPCKPNTIRNHYLRGIGPDYIQIVPLLELSCILFHLGNSPGPVLEGWVCILDHCLKTG